MFLVVDLTCLFKEIGDAWIRGVCGLEIPDESGCLEKSHRLWNCVASM